MHIKTIKEGPNRYKRELWMDEDTQVAHLWVIDYLMRIGVAEVRMAGIGGVYTERKHRMQGYMRHLFKDTVTYMRDEGYDLSLLFGIPNFYNKFGYATCLAKHEVRVATRDAEDVNDQAGDYASRPIEISDMPDVVALYNTKNATRSGTLVRDPEEFTEFPKGSDWGTGTESCLWEDASGQFIGYAVWDRNPERVRVVEVGAEDAALFPVMLSAFAQQAVEKRCESIELYLPPNFAFAEYLQRWGAVWQIEYPRYGDGMMRILNLDELFDKLAPELTRRLSGARLAQDSGSVALETDLGAVTLYASEGKVHVERGTSTEADLTLPQSVLMQLIVGYRSVRDVLNTPDVGLADRDALPLLTALFPKDIPYVWHPDHF
ncbi:MAG: GNAT family N-acetyltransferase [Anaerolineae bacterium]